MNKVKLGDVLDVKRGASLSGQFYAEKGDKIRLTLGNFDYPSGGFKENTSKKDIYFTGEVKPEFVLKRGDIITPLTEQVAGLLGETAIIPEDDRYIQSGDIGLIIPDEGKLDRLYAYYLVSSPMVKQQLGAGAQQTKIRHTSPEKIKDCIVWLPELSYQHLAGKLLDAIRDKIENNNRISGELESLAKSIYDYWFLQFEFPNEEGKPYKSSGGKMVWNEELKQGIPEGWKIGKLNELAQITMGSSPNGGSINEENDGIAFFQGKTDFGLRFPTVRAYTNDPVRYAEANDVLLSVRAPVGDINVAEDKCCIGRGIAAIHSQYQSYIYYTLLANQAQFDKYNCSGTTFGALTKDDLFNLKIIIPNIKILRIFNTRVKEYDNLIHILEKESQYLISLRDFLLPLLMNGQIEIESN